MKGRLLLCFCLFSVAALASAQTLVCYDELGRKSTILSFEPGSQRVVVEESGDAFVCAPEFIEYCTTSAGTLEQTATLWRFAWVREGDDVTTVFELNPENLSYFGDYAGGVWEGQCEWDEVK